MLLSLALLIIFCLWYYFILRQLLSFSLLSSKAENAFQHQLLVLCIPNPHDLTHYSNILSSCFLWLGSIPDGEIPCRSVYSIQYL